MIRVLGSFKDPSAAASSRNPKFPPGSSAATSGISATRTLEAVGIDLAVHLRSSSSPTAASRWRTIAAAVGGSRAVGEATSATRAAAEVASRSTTAGLGVCCPRARRSSWRGLVGSLDGAAESIWVHHCTLLTEHSGRGSRRGFRCFGVVRGWCSRILLLAFHIQYAQAVSVLAVLTTNDITKLLKALTANVESFRGIHLRGIVAEEDEGLQCRRGVDFLMDTPENVVEKRLKANRHASAVGELTIGFTA